MNNGAAKRPYLNGLLSEKYRALAGDFIETTDMMSDTQLAQAKALGG